MRVQIQENGTMITAKADENKPEDACNATECDVYKQSRDNKIERKRDAGS